MEYLLKLYVKKKELAEAIESGLKEQYNLDCEVIEAQGEIVMSGLNTAIVGFIVRDLNTGDDVPYVAIGSESDNSAKYRVHGFLEPHCPKCNMGYSMKSVGRYCSKCGTRIEYRI